MRRNSGRVRARKVTHLFAQADLVALIFFDPDVASQRQRLQRVDVCIAEDVSCRDAKRQRALHIERLVLVCDLIFWSVA